MIGFAFHVSYESRNALVEKYPDLAEIPSNEWFSDLPRAGEELAMDGSTRIDVIKDGDVRITLDDIEVQGVGFRAGMDFWLDQGVAKRELRDWILDAAESGSRVPAPDAGRKHFSRILEIHDTAGSNIFAERPWHPKGVEPVNGFHRASELLVDDVVRFGEGVRLECFRTRRSVKSDRITTARIIDEGYDEKIRQRTFKLKVQGSTGTKPHAKGKILVVPERDMVLSYTERKLWKDEKARTALLDERNQAPPVKGRLNVRTNPVSMGQEL